MIILAWANIVLAAICFLLLPLVWGSPQKAIGPAVFYRTVISAALVVPLCGRILGWW